MLCMLYIHLPFAHVHAGGIEFRVTDFSMEDDEADHHAVLNDEGDCFNVPLRIMCLACT